MGYRAIFPFAVYGPRGGLPTKFDAGHSEIHAGFLPEGTHQQGDFDLKCLPCRPFSFPPMCCLANLLQCMGIGHKPVWLSHTLRHFFLSHELSDVGGQLGGWQMSSPQTLILHLHAVRRHLAMDKAAPSAPDVSGTTQLIPGHFFFGNALDSQLEPAGGPPMRIDGLKHLSLLLTHIHLVIRLPAGASPGGFHPLRGCPHPTELLGGQACAGFGSHPPMGLHC